MVRSPQLRQEIDALDKIERAMADLPDKTRARVVGWVVDNFGGAAPGEALPPGHPPIGQDDPASASARGGEE